jgi:hypothetical protein
LANGAIVVGILLCNAQCHLENIKKVMSITRHWVLPANLAQGFAGQPLAQSKAALPPNDGSQSYAFAKLTLRNHAVSYVPPNGALAAALIALRLLAEGNSEAT